VGWRLHDIAITNHYPHCMVYGIQKGAPGEASYIAQKSCNISVMVWAMQVGGGVRVKGLTRGRLWRGGGWVGLYKIWFHFEASCTSQ